MITLRPSDHRGHTQLSWLDSHHTFSFGEYYDPKNRGFQDLRVINEDRVEPNQGFHTHSHRDMEIITYVLEGTLEHKDSLGTGTQIVPGDVQRMTAGTGVQHSEFNPSVDEAVHFLQIWILPNKTNLLPSYEQKHFDLSDQSLTILVSPDGRNNSITIHQDVIISGAKLQAHTTLTHTLEPHRYAWIQVARGKIAINEIEMSAGDGAAISNEQSLSIKAVEPSEFLLFDLN